MASNEVVVTIVTTTEIDPERVEEWVSANTHEDDQVQIMDSQTREVLYDSI